MNGGSFSRDGYAAALYADLALGQAFQSAVPLLRPYFSAAILARWARELCAVSAPDEATRAALEEVPLAAPGAAPHLTPRRFLRWTRVGVDFLQDAPEVSAAYFRASPEVLPLIGQRRVSPWAALGQRLCLSRGAPGGQPLAAGFFGESPKLFAAASFSDVARLVDLLSILATLSSEAAGKALQAASRALPSLDPVERRRSLALGARISSTEPALARHYLDTGLGLLSQLRVEARTPLLDAVARLAKASPSGLHGLLATAATGLDSLTPDQLGALLPLAAGVAERSPDAARALLRSATALFRHLSPEQLERWSRQGQELLRVHEASGVSYFRLQSRQAQEALALYSSVVTLPEVREVLRLYCQALMGRTISVLAAEDLAASGDQHTGWVAKEEINWEGPAIFAPAFMGDFATKDANFEAYKVLATHQAAHLEFGTYDFTFGGEGRLFRPLRQRIAALLSQERRHFADYDRFFDLFTDRRLVQDLFTLAEDERIDARVVEEYRGIRRAYQRAQQYALAGRPALSALPLREYFVELLVHASLRASVTYRVPSVFADHLATAVGMLHLIAEVAATPEDVSEAALRLYILLGQVPNVPAATVPQDQWAELDLADVRYNPEDEDLELLLRAFFQANQRQPLLASDETPAAAERPYSASPPVRHRRDMRPEVMQALLQLQREQAESEEDGGQFLELSLEELLQQLIDQAEYTDAWGGINEGASLDPRLLLSGYLRSLSDPESLRQRTSPLVESLAEPDVQVFHYDEWDYRTKAYRPAWCRLHQRTLKEGSEELYEEVLHRHPALVYGIRKQFEMLRPEGMGRVKRLQDGEEFDLDAVVESVVDKRAGHGLRDKVYWRRRKTERSVAVALLLDMSLSTDERVDQKARFLPPQLQATATAPPTRSGNGNSSKRIIEIEKEGLVLLIEALQQIGDSYGIYGFSGSGRSDVQFYVIKDIKEPFSARMKARIDKVTPIQGTRMGPAIRHTITKLEQEEARTKLLILLSDGRPQDRDYGTLPWELEGTQKGAYRPLESILELLGPDGVMTDEKDYAVQDTKAALNEAKAKHIIPFCLSIDKEGHDYLKAMCGDIGYEVVSDIESLPRRLPSFYRSLTT